MGDKCFFSVSHFAFPSFLYFCFRLLPEPWPLSPEPSLLVLEESLSRKYHRHIRLITGLYDLKIPL
jgi:hypothetical protein